MFSKHFELHHIGSFVGLVCKKGMRSSHGQPHSALIYAAIIFAMVKPADLVIRAFSEIRRIFVLPNSFTIQQ